MIVTKVLVLIVLIVILCIVSFLIKKTEQFSDIPFSGDNYDPNVIKEINKLNKIKHKENIKKHQKYNKQEALAKIQDLSGKIDTRMGKLMKIRDLLQMLPTCREIDLVPNNVGEGGRLEQYTDENLDDECNKHLLKDECYFKGAQGDKYCVWDKNLDDVTGNWKEDSDGYRCQLRKLNPKCDKIKKLNEAGDKFEYGPYIVPNAFENF